MHVMTHTEMRCITQASASGGKRETNGQRMRDGYQEIESEFLLLFVKLLLQWHE
jgi:hypothetical protein